MSPERFGQLPGGREVRACTLSVAHGPELTVLDLGATVQRLLVPDGDGSLHDVVLGYDDAASYLATSNPTSAERWAGAGTASPARFTLDGTTHRLSANERGTCLHGGADGFHTRTWTVVDRAADMVTMELVSPHGDEGFPGELTARATYSVSSNSVNIARGTRRRLPARHVTCARLRSSANGFGNGIRRWRPPASTTPSSGAARGCGEPPGSTTRLADGSWR